MKKTDLAYIAGIIDGEGCIGLRRETLRRKDKKYATVRLYVSVSNTNEWLLQWLRFSFRGSLAPCPRKNHQRLAWEWCIVFKQARAFLEAIYPYLRIKKPQAEIALRFQKAKKYGGRGHYKTDGERAVEEAQRILISNLNIKGKRVI